jgi:hypothetical protein
VCLGCLILLVASSLALSDPPQPTAADTAPSKAPRPSAGAEPDAVQTTPAQTDPTEARGTPAAGQVAYIDPETGQLTTELPAGARWPVATPEFVRSLSKDDVTVRTLPSGAVIASRPGGFRSSMLATLDENGVIRFKHVAPAPAPINRDVEDDAARNDETMEGTSDDR